MTYRDRLNAARRSLRETPRPVRDALAHAVNAAIVVPGATGEPSAGERRDAFWAELEAKMAAAVQRTCPDCGTVDTGFAGRPGCAWCGRLW